MNSLYHSHHVAPSLVYFDVPQYCGTHADLAYRLLSSILGVFNHLFFTGDELYMG